MSAAASEKSIFLHAIELGARSARPAYLDQACRDAPELRAEVEALLAAYDRLDAAAPTRSEGAADDSPTGVGPPRALATERGNVIGGRYVLREVIGEGGMGTVWWAEQTTPVRRPVAVKLIRPGMDSHQVVARFEAERQALALMDHPHIAKVLDGGLAEDGRPFFVMELVSGVPITRYSDEQQLTLRERLTLLVTVCQAVQHAHQKGVIHRDLKPSNVLVTLCDGRPVPKVIDFGVAKATGAALTDKTLLTGLGMLVGTPAFMSPEQAELDNRDVDTRSDVYSLGVLLYELLTGTTPLTRQRLKQASLWEVLRLVREEEPPPPSVRLTTMDDLPQVASHRRLGPRRLVGVVRGELDWIVLKALEKDRTRRYESAGAFAQDVQRYLEDEPVLASPPSTVYRLGKLARRNRGLLLTATLIFTVLIGGIIGTTAGLLRADRAARAEAEQRAAVERERDEKERQREAAVANLKKAREAVQRLLMRAAQERLLFTPQMEPLRHQLLRDALAFYQDFLGASPDDPVVYEETAVAYAQLGTFASQLGSYQEAEKALRRSVAMLQELADQGRLGADGHAKRIATLRSLASLFRTRSRQAEAVDTYQEALSHAERLQAEFPEQQARARAEVLLCCLSLGDVHTASDSHRAEPYLRRALALVGHPDVAPVTRASVYGAWARYQATVHRDIDAEPSYRQAIALWEAVASNQPRHTDHQVNLAATRRALATVLVRMARMSEAEALYRLALAQLTECHARSPLVTGYALSLGLCRAELADLCSRTGRVEEAEAEYRQAVALLERHRAEWSSYPLKVSPREGDGAPGPEASSEPGRAAEEAWSLVAEMTRARVGLARLLRTHGRTAEADACLRAIQEAHQTVHAANAASPTAWLWLARLHAGAARKLKTAGFAREGEPLCRLALGLFAQVLAGQPNHCEVAELLASEHHRLGSLLADQRRPTEAAEALAAAARRYGDLAKDGPRAPAFQFAQAASLHGSAEQLALAGRSAEAAQLCRRALALYDALPAEFQKRPGWGRNVAAAQNSLAGLLAGDDETLRGHAQAVALARQAVQHRPEEGAYWSTLGLAHYRAGDDAAAIAALTRAAALRPAPSPRDGFLRALAHGRRGEMEQARAWYDRAVAESEKLDPVPDDLRRLQVEAERLLRLRDSR